MRLFYSPASPFVRKVMITAHETGLADRIEVIPTALTPVAPNEQLIASNPLSKIPCLVTDEGLALMDSRVIVEYLDSLHGGTKIIPPQAPSRWQSLRIAALADEAMDALVLSRYETFVRPQALRWSDWIDNQLAKTRRSLDFLEKQSFSTGQPLCIGTISTACLLGYLDFRFESEIWRDGRPNLAAWFQHFSERVSMQTTAPKDMT